MTPRKLNLFFGFHSYSGNGGCKSEHPDVRDWFARTLVKADKDPRIEHIGWEDIADTPLDMCRNDMVQRAKDFGADILVCCDSDMSPDCELGEDPAAKPFYDSSLNFIYDHWDTGPVFIAAPYCGPPDWNNVYAFLWCNYCNEGVLNRPDYRLEAYSREHSEMMGGIQPAACGPTGLIMIDMRCFDLMERPDYYYYEMNAKRTKKNSTEDVTFTRDLSFQGMLKLGYNPFHINWDAWAGHWKPQLVRKPRSIGLEQVNEAYKKAVLAGHDSRDRLISVDFTRNGNGKVHA